MKASSGLHIIHSKVNVLFIFSIKILKNQNILLQCLKLLIKLLMKIIMHIYIVIVPPVTCYTNFSMFGVAWGRVFLYKNNYNTQHTLTLTTQHTTATHPVPHQPHPTPLNISPFIILLFHCTPIHRHPIRVVTCPWNVCEQIFCLNSEKIWNCPWIMSSVLKFYPNGN